MFLNRSGLLRLMIISTIHNRYVDQALESDFNKGSYPYADTPIGRHTRTEEEGGFPGEDSVSISRQGRELSTFQNSENGHIEDAQSCGNCGKCPKCVAEGIVAEGDKTESDIKTSQTEARKPNGEVLTAEEQREVEKLRRRDQKVHAHEQAHLAAAGNLAVGGAHYSYKTGPDGKQYAVSGEVKMSVKDAPTPEEDLRLAKQLENAALAPAEPSPQDRAIAQKARQKAAKAQREISQEAAENMGGQINIKISNAEDSNNIDRAPTSKEIQAGYGYYNPDITDSGRNINQPADGLIDRKLSAAGQSDNTGVEMSQAVNSNQSAIDNQSQISTTIEQSFPDKREESQPETIPHIEIDNGNYQFVLKESHIDLRV